MIPPITRTNKDGEGGGGAVGGGGFKHCLALSFVLCCGVASFLYRTSTRGKVFLKKKGKKPFYYPFYTRPNTLIQ